MKNQLRAKFQMNSDWYYTMEFKNNFKPKPINTKKKLIIQKSALENFKTAAMMYEQLAVTLVE